MNMGAGYESGSPQRDKKTINYHFLYTITKESNKIETVRRYRVLIEGE